MRISDWSSDVCSSDLAPALHDLEEEALAEIGAVELEVLARLVAVVEDVLRAQPRRELGGEVETGLQVVVVVVRDLEVSSGRKPRRFSAAAVAKMSPMAKAMRSEEGRGGKRCGRRCRIWGGPGY